MSECVCRQKIAKLVVGLRLSDADQQTNGGTADKTGEPLPYRVSYRPKIGANGLPTQLKEKLIHPHQG